MTRSKLVLAVVGLVVLLAGWQIVPPLLSQTTPPPPPVRIRVQVTHVKADMLQQWQDVIRTEAIPAQKKGGMAFRYTWADGGPFGENGTFVTIQPVGNFAQFDQPNTISRTLGADAYAKYQAKLLPTIVSSRAWIDTLQPNESIDSRAAAPPPLVLVQMFQALPGKGAEFAELWRTEYLPRYSKAGIRDVWYYTSMYGAPLGQITIVRPLAKYAELDQTPGLLQRGGLSPEAAQKINARRATLISGATSTVMRYVPDLSFGTPPRTSN